MAAVTNDSKTRPWRNAPFLELNNISIDIAKDERSDGSILLRSKITPLAVSHRMTASLVRWAQERPNGVFIGEKKYAEGGAFTWRTLTFAETLSRVEAIAQSLLDRDLSIERPLAILSENSIDHALLALAALHVGIPCSPVSPAYSLRSTDYSKLTHVLGLLTPGLVYASDGKQYHGALSTIPTSVEILCSKDPDKVGYTSFDSLLKNVPTKEVAEAFDAIKPDTVAKILFTSGSTGLPKGVINTHGNVTTNWGQITQTFPMLADAGLEFIDWLPWNHTFGGNHNFGLALHNGGSIYIDDGNPTPAGIGKTVASLRDRKPTVYFNVPKGFEELIPHLAADEKLGSQFFSSVRMLFYAGAGMAQHVWDSLEELAVRHTGRKIIIATGLGSTESSPSALFSSEPGGFAGLLGVPVPGLELKLVPREGKMEARYKGKNIFPGYWRQPELTAAAFDEEGFYCTGDALTFVDVTNPDKGLVFNGRIAEDFKLSTGTWVNVGVLKSRLISEGGGLIQDAVITGHNEDFVGAIIFPDLNYCSVQFGSKAKSSAEVAESVVVLNSLRASLIRLASLSTGSSTSIKKALIANFTLSIDRGEITDKGSINQRVIIENHQDQVARIYSADSNAVDIQDSKKK